MNVRKGNLPQRKQFAIRRQSYCIVSKSYSSFHFRCEITKKFCTLAFCFGRCLSYLSVKISNLIGHVSEEVGAVIHHFFKFINSKKLLFQVAQRCLLNLQLPLFAWIIRKCHPLPLPLSLSSLSHLLKNPNYALKLIVQKDIWIRKKSLLCDKSANRD